jgi:hypothetical protein
MKASLRGVLYCSSSQLGPIVLLRIPLFLPLFSQELWEFSCSKGVGVEVQLEMEILWRVVDS